MRLMLILLVVSVIEANFLVAQDIIILKEGNDSIYCEIIEDNITSLRYKLQNDPNIYNIKASLVDSYIRSSDWPGEWPDMNAPLESNAEYNDLIILETLDTIRCKILKEDTMVLYYEIFQDSVYTTSYSEIHHYAINREQSDAVIEDYTPPKTFPLPESMINLEFGTGVIYGGWGGAKLVLGFKNSGLSLGAGLGKELILGFDFGIQVGIKHGFINIGYGVVGYKTVSTFGYGITGFQTTSIITEPLYGPRLTTGGMIPLDKYKTFFLSLGFTYSYVYVYEQFPTNRERVDLIIPHLGVGFRL